MRIPLTRRDAIALAGAMTTLPALPACASSVLRGKKFDGERVDLRDYDAVMDCEFRNCRLIWGNRTRIVAYSIFNSCTEESARN